MWAWAAKLFGVATTTATSAPLMGIPGAVQAGAEAVHAVTDGVREANRAATLRAISAELERNAKEIDDAIAKATKLPVIALLMAFLALVALGCASVPPRDTGTATGNVGRLLRHSEFNAAAKAAPNFTKDALDSVNSLEGRLQIEQAKGSHVP